MTMSTTPPAAGKPLAQSRPDLPSWRAQQQHAVVLRKVTLRELFDSDLHRIDDFGFEDLGFDADFSEHSITLHTLRLLVELATQCGLENTIAEMFSGDKINVSEHRAALRTSGDRDIRTEFVSNIDVAQFVQTTRDLDPAHTLFVICSKSWHTSETLTNAATASDWLLKGLDSDTSAIARHFVAVCTLTDLTRDTEGRAWVRLIAPDGAGLTLWADAAYSFIEIYTAHTQPEPHWRTGLGVAPMTRALNAFRSGDRLIHLAPGESTSAKWGLRASPLGASKQSHSAAAGRGGAPDAPERPRGSSSSGRVAMSLLPAVS